MNGNVNIDGRNMINIPIWRKLNLTIEEAAKYSGIGENKLREIIKTPNCPFVITNGNRTLIKRIAFEKYNDSLIKL